MTFDHETGLVRITPDVDVPAGSSIGITPQAFLTLALQMADDLGADVPQLQP